MKELEENQRRVFSENTRKFFNNEFKGFEFKIGEKKLHFQPKDIEETVKSQSDLSNFVKKHLPNRSNLLAA